MKKRSEQMKNKNNALKFYAFNDTYTVSNITIKRKKLLTLVGEYNIALLFEALKRILYLKQNSKRVRVYFLASKQEKNAPILVIEDRNKKNKGVAIAPFIIEGEQ